MPSLMRCAEISLVRGSAQPIARPSLCGRRREPTAWSRRGHNGQAVFRRESRCIFPPGVLVRAGHPVATTIHRRQAFPPSRSNSPLVDRNRPQVGCLSYGVGVALFCRLRFFVGRSVTSAFSKRWRRASQSDTVSLSPSRSMNSPLRAIRRSSSSTSSRCILATRHCDRHCSGAVSTSEDGEQVVREEPAIAVELVFGSGIWCVG